MSRNRFVYGPKDSLVIDGNASGKSSKALDERRVAMWKSFDAKARSTEKAFITSVKAATKKQREKAAKIVASGDSVQSMIDSIVKMSNDKASNAELKNAMTPSWMLSFRAGYDHAKEALVKKAVTGTWDIVNPKFRTWIDTNGLLRAEGINDTTNEKLRKNLSASIAEGLDNGESVAALKNRILDATDEVYDEMDTTRANLIARTESIATVNYGQFETYKAEGVEKKEWLATQDDRTRDDHAEADGQVVGIDEEFDVGGDAMLAPGSGSDAAQNCNCRCTVLPVLEE